MMLVSSTVISEAICVSSAGGTLSFCIIPFKTAAFTGLLAVIFKSGVKSVPSLVSKWSFPSSLLAIIYVSLPKRSRYFLVFSDILMVFSYPVLSPREFPRAAPGVFACSITLICVLTPVFR